MRGYLVDSHVLVWAFGNDRRLSKEARRVLVEEAQVWVSVASLWELSLKQASGKLQMPDLDDVLPHFGIRELPVTWLHVRQTRNLPRHHGDPFDRVLIAQAMVEDLVLVTTDAAMSAYPVRTTY
jgi:PIN domain nuclease of toxin-antitoxin system